MDTGDVFRASGGDTAPRRSEFDERSGAGGARGADVLRPTQAPSVEELRDGEYDPSQVAMTRPIVEELGDVGVLAVTAEPVQQPKVTPEEYVAKTRILRLRALYPTHETAIDAMVREQVARGVPAVEIAGILEYELEMRIKPAVEKRRKDVLRRMQNPRTRGDVEPADGFEREAARMWGRSGGEKANEEGDTGNGDAREKCLVY